MVDAIGAHRARPREFAVRRIVELCDRITAARNQYSPVGEQRRGLPITAFSHVSRWTEFLGTPIKQLGPIIATAGYQYLAAGNQSRCEFVASRRHRGGRAKGASSGIENLAGGQDRRHRRSRKDDHRHQHGIDPARNQYATVAQDGGCLTIAMSGHRRKGSEGAGDRVIDLDRIQYRRTVAGRHTDSARASGHQHQRTHRDGGRRLWRWSGSRFGLRVMMAALMVTSASGGSSRQHQKHSDHHERGARRL